MRQKGLMRGTRNYPTISGHLLAGATLLKTQGEAPPTHEYVWDIDKLVDIMPDLTLEDFDEDGEKILPTQQELISSFEFSSREATVQADFHTIPISEIDRYLLRRGYVITFIVCPGPYVQFNQDFYRHIST